MEKERGAKGDTNLRETVMRQVHVVASDCRKWRLLLHGLMRSLKHEGNKSVINILAVVCKQLIVCIFFFTF